MENYECIYCKDGITEERVVIVHQLGSPDVVGPFHPECGPLHIGDVLVTRNPNADLEAISIYRDLIDLFCN